MTLTLELRTRLYNQCILHNLRYDGPGRVVVDAAPDGVAAVVEMLSVAQRADLALAVVSAMPAAAGATALESVLRRHRDLIDAGLVRAEQAIAAVASLPTGDAGESPRLRAPDDAEILAALTGALSGDSAAAFRLAELLRGGGGVLTASGACQPGGEAVDPVFTWKLCTALWGVDRLLASSIAEALCTAVVRCVAVGVFAPEALTVGGQPLGRSEAAATAAAVLLLSELLPGVVPLDGTPAARGTPADEQLFLAGARRLPADAEVGPGLSAGALLAEHARPAAVAGVRYQAGVEYGEAEGVPLRMHLFTPAPEADPAPVVVFVHGGGWESGNPAKFLRQAADWAAHGWITLSIGYRLVPQAVWPGQLHDVLTALRYIATHAEALGADPSRVGLVGNSAGGHLALMAASREEAMDTGVRISGVVAISPLTDTQWPSLVPDGGRLVRRLVGGDESLLADASPAAFVQAAMPPVLTVTGGLDALTTPGMVEDYHRRLDDAGIRNELCVLPGRFHAFEFAPADSRWWSGRAFSWLSECFAGARVSS
jgi:acetyl esterase/lipase